MENLLQQTAAERRVIFAGLIPAADDCPEVGRMNDGAFDSFFQGWMQRRTLHGRLKIDLC